MALLAYKPYRTWVAMQLCLIAAALRNLWTKEVVWRKEDKTPANRGAGPCGGPDGRWGEEARPGGGA